MTIQGMHFDLKQKLNKLDSQKYRNLKVPEIDWKLREAQNIYVMMIAQPSIRNQVGFEVNQRSIDDIRTVVIDQKKGEGIKPVEFDDRSYIATLPDEYWFYTNSKVYCTKDKCVARCKTREIQHDDEAEESVFDKSSFEWREVNLWFTGEGIRLFTDGTFSIDELVMSYLREPRIVYNAADWIGGSYVDLDGKVLTGRQDCELPSRLHGEIVDLAAFIIAGELNLPIQAKMNKLSLTK